jgi:glycosyltransferase involved in cell wall biosynthesis
VTILFLDQYSDMGGGQRALLDTVDAVRAQRWEAHALVPGEGPLVRALESRSIPKEAIACGPYSSGSKSVWDALHFAIDLGPQIRTIRAAIAQQDVSLLYVNGPRLLPAAALAARNRTPIVFHLHNHLRGAAARLARLSVSSASAVIGCSNSVFGPLRASFPPEETQVIPNGVGDAGYREREFDLGRRVRIGIIGRIAPEKGQADFIDAAAALRVEFPQAAFFVCGAPLFGTGGDYFASIQLRARGLPVDFIGWQDGASGVLHDLDLLAVPSSAEGMGRVVLEAFSAGVPVVAYPAGGIPEAVIDNVTGFLTRDFTAAALAARIREAIHSDRDTLRRIAWNARRAWAQTYTLDAYQTRVTSLLETVTTAWKEARAVETPRPLKWSRRPPAPADIRSAPATIPRWMRQWLGPRKTPEN